MLARPNISTSALQLLRRHAPGLPALDGDVAATNLFEFGLTSLAAVKLMLALEAEFNIAIPDADLTPENFSRLDKIVALVERLKGG